MPSKKDVKCRHCPTLIARQTQSGLCWSCFAKDKAARAPAARVQADRTVQTLKDELSVTKLKYVAALNKIKSLEHELGVVTDLGRNTLSPVSIEPQLASGTAEGTVVLVASDWHVEERVDPSKVSYLNRFDPEIAEARAKKFFSSGLRLVKLLQQDIKIKNVVLALLGDFISNELHEDSAEHNALQPMHAVAFASDLIAGGVNHLMDGTDFNLEVVAHSGNHARVTRRTRFGAENGHSLEYLMYLGLKKEFKAEKRINFNVADGYHSYMDVYGETIRFHHGHAINYQGGIGGIFIPAFKAISQWDKARRADLDVFGHFHQMKDGGKFICNGSLIGYNAFGLSIKADYERPQQTLFLMDKNRGRTCTWPILLEKKEAK